MQFRYHDGTVTKYTYDAENRLPLRKETRLSPPSPTGPTACAKR
ncbi:hypothetical protein ACFQ49_06935 [Kroppenstedtia eburnea]